MADVMKLLKETMLLTANVGELKNGVGRLTDKVEQHAERILKLEMREELLAEKMSNAAIKAVYEMNAQYFNRVNAIEQHLGFSPQTQQENTFSPQIEK